MTRLAQIGEGITAAVVLGAWCVILANIVLTAIVILTGGV